MKYFGWHISAQHISHQLHENTAFQISNDNFLFRPYYGLKFGRTIKTSESSFLVMT